MKTLREMLAEARQVVPEEGPEDLVRRLKSDTPPVVIDVRDPDEYRDGHVEAATNISRGFLEFRIGGAVSEPSTPVVLYCQTGLRSMLAAKALKDLGYQNVVNLQGGYQKWVQSGLPVVRELPMSPEQLQRYSRHFLLAQIGDKGQRKLLRSKVLVIGAGGLGSPTAFYLAAAGVGTLGIVDADVVDASNLQRQVLHATSRLGSPKVTVAVLDTGVDYQHVDLQGRVDLSRAEHHVEEVCVLPGERHVGSPERTEALERRDVRRQRVEEATLPGARRGARRVRGARPVQGPPGTL